MFQKATVTGRPVRLRAAAIILLAAGLGALAGCTSDSGPDLSASAALPAAPAVSITAADLVGNWGLASFLKDEDRARTEAEAKRLCSNPYRVTPGPKGGAMMYLADQKQPSEVFVKTAPGGRVFIGPPGAPGEIKDREVVSFQNGILVASWLDPTVTARYGTMVFARCGDGAPVLAPAPAAKPTTS